MTAWTDGHTKERDDCMKKRETVFSVIKKLEDKIPEIQFTSEIGATVNYFNPFNVRYALLREYVTSYEYDEERNILHISYSPYSEDFNT